MDARYNSVLAEEPCPASSKISGNGVKKKVDTVAQTIVVSKNVFLDVTPCGS
jgi:hypothetical protein